MEFYTSLSLSLPLLKFILLLLLLFWYEDLIPAFVKLNKHPLHLFSSFGWGVGLVTFVIANVLYLIFFVVQALSRLVTWRQSGFTTMYGEFFLSVKTLWHPFNLLPFSHGGPHYILTYFTITITGLTLFLDYILSWVLYLLSLVRFFFQLALLPIKVTYILILFWYRIFLDLNLYPQTSTRNSFQTLLAQGVAVIEFYSSYYTISQITRVFWWKLLIQKVTDNFFFLKRFYRINDLLWQDGFLFDFIQKKIVDRWVRTFVIYSGYLFSERLWFDVVVRFYIDFVIWPGYQYSIYEFTSISTTLVTILSLLVLLFYLVFLYYLFILLL